MTKAKVTIEIGNINFTEYVIIVAIYNFSPDRIS